MVNSFNNHNTSPSHKLEKIKKVCRHVTYKYKVTAQQLAHLISLLSSVIAPAPLHYWALQRLWNKALQQEGLQSPNKDGPGILEKASLVDLQSKKNLWSPDNATSSKRSNHIRCLDNKMWRNLSEHKYRILDKAGENLPHKHIGIEGSSHRHSDLCSTSQQLPHSVVVDNKTAIVYINHKGEFILGPCQT